MSLPNKLQVKVTQKHIDDGIAESDTHCPIALAVGELLGISQDHIEVDSDQITIDDISGYDLPDLAREFVRAFDAGDPVEPIEFETDECAVAA